MQLRRKEWSHIKKEIDEEIKNTGKSIEKIIKEGMSQLGEEKKAKIRIVRSFKCEKPPEHLQSVSERETLIKLE